MRLKRLALMAVPSLLLCADMGRAVAGQVLYDGIGLVAGQQTLTDTFSVSGPGTLTVTLKDMEFPSPFANLDLIVSGVHGLLGPESGSGTVSFQIAGPQQIYVQALAHAEGQLDSGVYGLNVMFQASPVPLPTSIALLGSGLFLLLWNRRHGAQVSRAARTQAV